MEPPEVCDPYCAICRPSKAPWAWDGPYQTYRWSAHLIGYPGCINVTCDAPDCQIIAECEGKLDDTPAMRYRSAQRHLAEHEGWAWDRSGTYCPKHSGLARGSQLGVVPDHAG